MNSIESQFVPYEIAVKLKELGFDDICITKYGMSSKRFYDNYKPYKNSEDIYPDSGTFCNDLVAAPLWQQAFDWFRINNGMYAHVLAKESNQDGSEYFIPVVNDIELIDYGAYESARLACLEKLIELVTEKKK